MHTQPPSFDHPRLLLVLAIANIPLYLVFGRMVFTSWQVFFSCLRSIGILEYARYLARERLEPREAPDRQVDAFYEVMRLLLFVLGLLACIGAEYHLIAWLFLR